ncbi:hypothetical protein MMPV_006254 [Pyropia vietnamensis]
MNSRCHGGGGWLTPTRPTERLWRWVLVAMMAVAAGVARGGVPTVAATSSAAGKPAVRRYYLSAELHTWDFVPSGINQCSGRPFEGILEELTAMAGPGGRHGSVYVKAHYVAYTDDTFSTPALVDPQMGAVGPALYAAAGDDLHVTLRNQLDYPIDLQVGGLAATAKTAAVAPGATRVYGFTVGAAAAPPPAGRPGGYVPSMMHVYGSEVNISHVNAGLYGPLVVTRREDADADGKPAGYANVFTFLHTFLEYESPHFAASLKVAPPISQEPLPPGASPVSVNQHNMHGVNGYMFCHLPMSMPAGGKVLWHASALGISSAVHPLHFHGIVGVTAGGAHVDVLQLLPRVTTTLDMILDNPGTWLAHCHVNFHLATGMVFTFNVTGQVPRPRSPGRLRQYFVAAEDGVWDYFRANGSCSPGTTEARTFTDANLPVGTAGGVTLGSAYVKTRYAQYTDASFSVRSPRPPEWEHLGLVGPILRAEVGDTLRVTFLNRAEAFPHSMHPHGVWYTKGNEGAPYEDGSASTDEVDDAVPPNATHVYEWLVPERAGPGPGESEGGGGTKLWMYHSHTDEIGDTNAGLMGALIVVAPSASGRTYDPDTLLPIDVDRELVLFFSLLDESKLTGSVHADTNLRRNRRMAALPPARQAAVAADQAFVLSNVMHSINGYVFCSMPPPTLTRGDRVRVHMFSLGSTFDIHTPTVGPAVQQHDDESAEVVSVGRLMPGSFYSAKVTMTIRSPSFSVMCSTLDHIKGGMTARVNVVPRSSTPAPQADTSLCTATPDKRRDKRARIYTHYIAAEHIKWDYSPRRRDECSGTPLTPAQQASITPTVDSPGARSFKARYQEYTDGTFSRELLERQPYSHGLLGPLIHAQVGDKLRVVILNRDVPFNVTWAIGGPRLICSAVEGVGQPGLASVAAGHTLTIVYSVGEEAAPAPDRSPPAVRDEPGTTSSTAAYIAFSIVPGAGDAGLLSVVAVTRRGGLSRDRSHPIDVDAATAVSLQLIDEQRSPLLNASLASYGDPSVPASPASDLLRYSVGGYLWCGGSPVRLSPNTRTRVYVASWGGQKSSHTLRWGPGVLPVGRPVASAADVGGGVGDVAPLLPAEVAAMDVWVPDGQKGMSTVACGVENHAANGMVASVVLGGRGRRPGRGRY